MRVHFIAIGGSAMHNLAIALHKKGYEVSFFGKWHLIEGGI